jgi:hypothetical protein
MNGWGVGISIIFIIVFIILIAVFAQQKEKYKKVEDISDLKDIKLAYFLRNNDKDNDVYDKDEWYYIYKEYDENVHSKFDYMKLIEIDPEQSTVTVEFHHYDKDTETYQEAKTVQLMDWVLYRNEEKDDEINYILVHKDNPEKDETYMSGPFIVLGSSFCLLFSLMVLVFFWRL